MVARTISLLVPIFVKRILLSKMKLVILPTKYLSDQLKLNNSQIIHQGIDCDLFKKERKKEGTTKNKEQVIVSYFGHLSASKGLLEVVNAFSKIDDKNIQKRIYVTYPGKKFKKYVKSKDKSIQVLGVIKDIVTEYNKSDIIVLPYRHECSAIATPLVLLEAMACERAIITTSLFHLKEICGNSVVYVSPSNDDALAKSIMSLAKKKEKRENLGKKARERVVKHHNEKKMIKEYDKVYKLNS